MRPLAPPAALGTDGVRRALAHLQTVVRAKGLKSSTVRDALARVALEQEGHFTAEELLTTLRRDKQMNVHPATIYRVLPLLVDAGLLQLALVSKGNEQRYERAFERAHHDHIICTSCGKVVEFHFEALEVLQRELSESLGFRLTGHVHELFGVCSTCEPHFS